MVLLYDIHPGAGQELDPGGVPRQQGTAQDGTDEELRDGADHDLRQGGGDAQPEGQERGEQGQPQPEGCLGSDLGHGAAPLVKPKSTGTRR